LIDTKVWRFIVLDSLHSINKDHHLKTIQDLKLFFSIFLENEMINKTWSYTCAATIPLQIGLSDCGLLTCINLGIMSRKGADVSDIIYDVKADGFS
jgi:Ulp1 family protease